MPAFVDKFLFKRYKKVTSMTAVATLASPTLKLIDYITQGGESVNEPCLLDGPQGFSYDFTQAQASSAVSGRGASHYEQWNSTYGEYFGSVRVSARAVAAAKGREDAFLRQLTEVMDSGLKKFGHIAARKYLGPAGGYIGSATGKSAGTGGTAGDPGFATAGSTAAVVLNDPSLAIHFAPGMRVHFSASTKGGSLVHASVVTVSHVNLSAGIVQFSGATTQNGFAEAVTAADTDQTVYIFRAGDYQTGTDDGIAIRGIGAWNPLTAIVGTTDSFNGVDRGQHELLSGCRLTASEAQGLSIKERIEMLVNKMRNQAAAYDTTHVAVHGSVWMKLSHDVQSYGWLSFGKVLEIGAGEIAIMTPNGVIKVINEPHMPIDDIRVFSQKDMKCYNYDGFPGYAEEEGLRMVKVYNATDYEVRYQAFSNMTVNGRPWNFGIAPSGVSAA